MARVTVRVQPRSSRNAWQVEGDAVKVWLTAAPTDGQANAALCELIAEAVGVAKSCVRIVRGHSSRIKELEIERLSLQEVMDRLADV